ncbi:hypothetical protein MMC28_007946 [Mycoblastus sanguinarius]|nr:hypothetical protein [Mycoblastus sanguinarius]
MARACDAVDALTQGEQDSDFERRCTCIEGALDECLNRADAEFVGKGASEEAILGCGGVIESGAGGDKVEGWIVGEGDASWLREVGDVFGGHGRDGRMFWSLVGSWSDKVDGCVNEW